MNNMGLTKPAELRPWDEAYIHNLGGIRRCVRTGQGEHTAIAIEVACRQHLNTVASDRAQEAKLPVCIRGRRFHLKVIS
jgi:hypothetical protein